jgi:hypothetical protein
VPFHDGVVSQFAGYERLKRLDLDSYRARYGNIGRLDLILEAEGDTVRRYQVAKQADTLMLCYLLSPAGLAQVFGQLRYNLTAEMIRRTVAYYTPRVTLPRGARLGRRPAGPGRLVAVLHQRARRRHGRYSRWYYRRGHPPRRDGQHRRYPPALLSGAGDP